MAHIRKRDTGYQAIVTLPDGRQVSRTDKLKKTVAAWASEVESDIRRGRWNDPRPARAKTLQDWRTEWSQRRLVEAATRKKDDSHWRSRVEPQWGDARLSDIKRSAVQAWITQMAADGVGPHSIAGAVNHLGSLLQAAIEHDPPLLMTNAARGLTLPRASKGRLRFFSRAEWKAIDAELPEPHRTLVELACFTGLRWGELAGLDRVNVDLERGELHVRRVLTRDGLREYGKSDRSHRTVPLTPSLVAALTPLVAHAGDQEHGLVFTGEGGKELDESNFRQRVWATALGTAGVAYAPPHTCRHTAASWLVMAGVDLYRVQALLGHESYKTTERYAHLAPAAHDAVRQAWAQM